jgi:RNA polymerase sigma-70 factor, ECF subfamily
MTTFPEDADSSAMRRLREGEDLALNEIMERWQRRVTSYLLRFTGNETVAIDLAQETFVRVYQSRERYRPQAKFSTWLFAIASNLAREHLRW